MKTKQQAVGIIDADPELVAWSDEQVQAVIKDHRQDEPNVNDGPVLAHYRVSFMYPHSYEVVAFTISEAIAKAIALLREAVAVYDPQVESVVLTESVVPVCECCGQQRDEDRVIARIRGGKVVAQHIVKV